MTTLAPWTEQWQHFHREIQEEFWGDLTQHTRQSWQDFLGRLSIEARDRYLGVREYDRMPDRVDARNGFYERDFVTRLGTLRVRVARTRQRLPAGWADTIGAAGDGDARVDLRTLLTRIQHAGRGTDGRVAHRGGRSAPRPSRV